MSADAIGVELDRAQEFLFRVLPIPVTDQFDRADDQVRIRQAVVNFHRFPRRLFGSLRRTVEGQSYICRSKLRVLSDCFFVILDRSPEMLVSRWLHALLIR